MAEVSVLVLFPAPAPGPYRLFADEDLGLPISHVILETILSWKGISKQVVKCNC